MRGGARNDVRLNPGDVTFGAGFAPVRVNVQARGEVAIDVGEDGERSRRVDVQAEASAALSPWLGNPLGGPAFGSGGGYDGPLAYRMGKPVRPSEGRSQAWVSAG